MSTLTDRSRPRNLPKPIQKLLRNTRLLHARKDRMARRRLERIHEQIPKLIRTVLDSLEPAFAWVTHRRFYLLVQATILGLGRRTINNLLRGLGPRHQGVMVQREMD